MVFSNGFQNVEFGVVFSYFVEEFRLNAMSLYANLMVYLKIRQMQEQKRQSFFPIKIPNSMKAWYYFHASRF